MLIILCKIFPTFQLLELTKNTCIGILRYNSMGLTKTKDLSSREVEIAEYCRVLGSPARIAILNLIIKQKACVCGELVDQLPLAQSTISQHLRELKLLGLIQGEIEGPKLCYCINKEKWKEMTQLLNEFFQEGQKLPLSEKYC